MADDFGGRHRAELAAHLEEERLAKEREALHRAAQERSRRMLEADDLARLGVNPAALGNVGPFSAEQGVYLAFHRKEIFHAEV